ncbi:MAG: hypothetical protein ACTHL3_05600 [Candidatus Nitrosocosmicus sp.]
MAIPLHLRKLLHKKLLARLTIPLVISAVMLAISIIDLFSIPIPPITFVWLIVGIIIGYPFGRLTKISWNSDKTQLILVGSGIGLLVIFILIRIITSIVIRMEFGYLSYVLDIVFLVSAGGTIGRALGMVRQIRLALI